MAYTPTEWKDGDVITAEKLNNIEEGIEGDSSILKVYFTQDSQDLTVWTSDVPIQDIITAINGGALVVAFGTSIYPFIIECIEEECSGSSYGAGGDETGLFLLFHAFTSGDGNTWNDRSVIARVELS